MKKNLLLLSSLLALGSLSGLRAQGDVQLISIVDARGMALGEVVKVKGVVTSNKYVDDQLRYFQDETAGIAVYSGSSTFGYPINDTEVGDTIQVTGALSSFNGLLQVNLTSNTDVANVELIYDRSEDATPTALPQPKIITGSDLGDDIEGQLVKFTSAKFVNPPATFFRGNIDMTDGGDDFAMRLAESNHPLIGKTVPTGFVEITGVIGEFRGTYQIFPRDLNDLIAGLSIENYVQSLAGMRSVNLSFATTLVTNGSVKYKRYDQSTDAFKTIVLPQGRNRYNVTIPNLEPGQLYDVEITTVSAEDETKTLSILERIATKSESTGDIEVYFNYMPDNLPTDISFEQVNYINDFASKIATEIDGAQLSVDVAIYNVNSGGDAILGAINRAYERGVRVRYLYQKDNFDAELNTLNGSIKVYGREEGDGIMHNKFVIIDAESTFNSHVITGSTNWTSNNLNDDSNDLLIIQDQALARAYTVEFDEMWGSSTLNTTTAQLTFGADKEDNVPHLYNIGGNKVQLYFSPTDAINSRIIEAIGDTRSDIRFALADITRNDLTDSLISEAQRGWSVKGLIHADEFIIENNSITTEDISADKIQDFLDTNGLVDLVVDSVSGLHHKFMVVNTTRPDADPFVLTGSHNWTTSADGINDENTLVIYNQEIAEAYLNHWRILYWAASKGGRDQVLTSVENDILNSEVAVYPVPATDNLFIKNNTQGAVEVQIITANGQRVQTLTVTPSAQPESVSLQHLNAGVYFVKIQSANAVTTKTIILTR